MYNMWNFSISNQRLKNPTTKAPVNPPVNPPVNTPVKAAIKPPLETLPSNILIVMDELIAYHNLPSWLLTRLPGYQAFAKLGIEFTNIHNNRQMC